MEAVAVLIGTAFLNSSIDLLVKKLGSPEVLRYFKTQKLNDRRLKDLKATMRSVNKLLNDAENKQVTDSDVKDWLDELKDAVYEAEDFFDEITYEAQRLEIEAGPDQCRTCTDQARTFLSSRILCKKEMGETVPKLKEISRTLEYLLKQKDDLGLREAIGGKSPFESVPKTSSPEDSEFFGRNNDQEAIVKLLLSANACGKHIQVIPIVGMGGIGKTTLAQLLYRDNRVQECFNLKAWIYVSEDFDHLKVTKDLLKQVGITDCNTMTENQLHEELEKKLKDKKVLIVLDDVWNDNASDKWGFLLAPLKVVGEGSKIIVTTRHESVTSLLEKRSTILVVSTYHLKELTDDSCWLLFSKCAFPKNNVSAYPHLEKFGREIVRKCGGLPLAARTLGALLCSNTDAREWEEILNSNMWDLPNVEVLPALRLSYYSLPSHLKQCFAYCAVFPKGYKFGKEEVTLLWMAEGFIVQPKGGEELQMIGDKYFDDLVSRSFFQRSSTGDSEGFIMHDLINDLAQDVSGRFCFKLGDGNSKYEHGLQDDNSCKLPKEARYLSYPASRFHDASKIFEGIHGFQYPLRTFLPQTKGRQAGLGNEVLLNMLVILKRLRVLSLPHFQDLRQLPDSIGTLKHLRYLDLSYTAIERLPEIVSTLYNLQTLNLHGCQSLIKLPTNMSKLINLQHLDIYWTKLMEMPSRMGKFTKLRKLTDFFLGKQSGSSIKELGKLEHLQGRLRIWNLQNVMDVIDALEANLKGKKQLHKLELSWDGDTHDSQHEIEVLERLEPHTNVKRLRIGGYGGTKFPDWVGDSSYSNLVSLKLYRCKSCTFLPPLGQLASLEKLRIERFDGVVDVGSEFYGTDPLMEKPFKSLKWLYIGMMPQWKEWNSDVAGAFPLLENLYIQSCPKLTNALPSHLPSLWKLEITECPILLVSIAVAPNLTTISVSDINYSSRKSARVLSTGKLHLEVKRDSLSKGMEQMSVPCLSPSLQEINISNCESLECFQLELFPKIETLGIWSCENLESLCLGEGPRGDFTSLGSLSIYDCPSFVTFAEGRLSAPNLTKIWLWDCRKLKSLPESMHSLLPSLEILQLTSLPEVDSFPKGGLPSKLQSLGIKDCNKLIAGRMQWDLQSLPSLSTFKIGINEDVESFPEETLLPSTLTSLEISYLSNLKSLNYMGLQNLTSLEKLSIKSCSELVSLPEETKQYPITSLKRLNICSCPKIESLPVVGLSSSKLQSLSIRSCDNLIARRMQWDLQSHPSLSHLGIANTDDVESFPEETLLPSTLTSLEILYLRNLKSLDSKGLQHLTSLRELKIWHCDNLQSMPEEGLPSSLSSLEILNCSLLKKMRESEKGKDWAKISQIPNIVIDRKKIN